MEPSPLDQIRQVEAEVAQEIAAARDRAEAAVREARGKVKDKREAQEIARREGENHYQDIIAKAAKEAEALVEQAKKQAEEFRKTGKSRIDDAIRFIVSTVVGSQEEEADV
jgi:vacuolar-type H+-ATPase subunit H